MYLKYEVNDKNTINASVTSRISRPSYSALNPFVYYTDQYNRTMGNPALQPERSYFAELAYTYNNNLTLSASYRYIDDVIGLVNNFNDESKITEYMWENHMVNQLAIFNATYTYNKLSWLNTYITANAYFLNNSSDAYSE